MLVEREALLATLTRAGAAVGAAEQPRGGVVIVGGEAGVGKTALVAALLADLPEAVTVRRGWCDDILVAAGLGAVVEAVPEVAGQLDGDRPALFHRIAGVLAARPTVLVLEDVHWADEATIDLLRFLARRAHELPLLVVVTYRDDEVPRPHPLTRLLGEARSSNGVQRLTVPPLSADGVAQLVAAAGRTPDVDDLHGATGGNPFFVTEVLAAPGDAVPATVRDAVRARVAGLGPAAEAVLAAAAVLGPRTDAGRIVAVAAGAGGNDGGLDGGLDGLDQCVGAGVLVADGPGWSFRHELARRVIDADLPPGRRALLHARAYAALQGPDADDRRLAHHAAGAGDARAVLEHAPRAATTAAALGAHREAAELLRMALRARPADPATRRRLYESLSYECYLTDQLDEALTARRRVLELATLAGDAPATGDAERWLSRLSWFVGRNDDSRRYAELAVRTLSPLGDGPELAMAYSNVAQLCMLADDHAGAVDWGRRALDLARTLGEAEIEIHAANNVGTALAFGGGGGGEAGPHTAEGRDLLHRSLALAIALDRPEHAARAYTNLGSGAVKTRCHAEGERVLRSGIAYCTDRDLDSWRLYMSAWLARTLCEQGRLGEASRVAAEVLATPQLSTISFLSAAPAVLADLRRGLPAGGVLHRAVALARATGEPQRVVPIAAARAEAAWLAGRLDEAGDELTAAWEATHTHADGWHAGELAWWLRLAGVRLPDLRPASLPAPLAALLGGDWSAAADAWLALGCPLWAAQALNRSHRLEDARRALQLADDCGAVAVVDALRRDRRAAGLVVPRGPRPSSQANPAALTTREIEVLRLLGDGHSNADIATALVLSAKTVGHHVSAVLRKLDEPTRARAAAAARQRGIL